jgi:hypothetical protein
MTNSPLKPREKPHGSVRVVSGQSAWNRSVRNTSAAMAQHLGGDITEPERMIIRRVAVIEAELAEMELKIAHDRFHKIEVEEKFLDLYGRMANAQRRFLETVGLKRVPKDVTPTLSEYLEGTNK